MRNKRLRNDELQAAIRVHENAMMAMERKAKSRRWWKPWKWKDCIMAAIIMAEEHAIAAAYRHALEGGRKDA